jgi:hypothetical protein
MSFATISLANLSNIVGGVNRDRQVDTNGAITGGARIVRQPQHDENGAITGGQRIHRARQFDLNGAITGGNRQ